MRVRFTMLIGLPGSGKSTIAEEILSEHINTKLVSSDNIREELYGDTAIQGEPNIVFQIMQDRALDYLSHGFDVIYDATNLTRKNRKKILDKLPGYVIKIGRIAWAPIGICKERNENRERRVPDFVIERMVRQFEAPFYDEGFEIIICNNTTSIDRDEYTYDIMESLYIPHNNHHHLENISEHCTKCGDYLADLGCSDLLVAAGYYHDIGKPYTKDFHDAKGNPTEEAHFYGHHAVGAWMSYGLKAMVNRITLAWLISSHMIPWLQPKYYNSLPHYLREYIDLLHEADIRNAFGIDSL